jgi:hypothetical protein
MRGTLNLRAYTLARSSAFIVLVFITLAQSVEACSCAPPAGCKLPLDFPLIFTGKAVRKQIWYARQVAGTSPDGRPVPSPPPPPGAPSTVTFAVSEYLNGQSGPEVNINTSEDCCACGYLFTEDIEYIVFAYPQQGGWSTSACTPTRPLNTAAALLEQLRAVRSKASVAQVYGFAGRAPEDPSSAARWNMEPVSNMRVQAIGSRRTFEVVTSANGAFTFSDLPADTYRIEPVPPVGMTMAEVALRTPVRKFEIRTDTRGCEANLRLLNDGEFSGVLVSPAGKPVRGLVRGLRVDESIPEPERVVVSHETEADGRFRLPLIAPGKYRICVSPQRDGKIDYSRKIYYPGVTNSTEARTFDLGIGERVDRLRFVIPEE